MAVWIFNRSGKATLIHDGDCIRDNHGRVSAWISGINVYSLRGRHCGWFEHGVLFDSRNRALGFLGNASGHLPSHPSTSGAPGMPGFGSRPGHPSFSSVPSRGSYGGWSDKDLSTYFTNQ
ncbi:MAG TPA: hypothetical protein VGL38_06030 [bacterium]